MAATLSPRRKAVIEIPLPSIRKYVPGSGPPPPRISLAPPRDSTAYIIDQFVLPTDKDMTPTSRRLIHYHIGFTDLPAVKLLVPCNKVLEYVSPRELEDWEYQNLEHKEEERARLLAEKQRAKPAKKKPGRPPNVPMADVGRSALSAAEEALFLVQQVVGPSLSTPQKRKVRPILDEEEIGDSTNVESDDAVIYQQLQGGAGSGGTDEFEDDQELDSEPVDQLVFPDDTSSGEAPSRPRSLAPSLQDPLPTRPATSPPAASTPPSGNASTPGRIHPAWAHVFGQQTRSENPPKVQSQNGFAPHNGTPWSVLAKAQQPKAPQIRTSTPGSTFKPAGRSNGPSSISTIPAVGSDSLAVKRKGQPNGKGSPQETQQTKKQKLKQEAEPAADEWEVKELLDDRWIIEQGVKAHMYLVLWAGDWPADQNPTWEPAENVQDQGLVQRYQHKKKAGLLKPGQKTQKTLHRYLAGAKYSSVAEAFEGGIDDETGFAAGMERDADLPEETFRVTETVGDVMENGTKAAPVSSFGSFDNLLAQYNRSFPRR